MIFNTFSKFFSMSETHENHNVSLDRPRLSFSSTWRIRCSMFAIKAPKLVKVVSFPHSSSNHLSNQSSKVGTAECAERSAAPRCGVLDLRSEGTCQFFFVSSSSCLHLQAFMPSTFCFNFFLQFFALFLAVLEGFVSPP